MSMTYRQLSIDAVDYDEIAALKRDPNVLDIIITDFDTTEHIHYHRPGDDTWQVIYGRKYKEDLLDTIERIDSIRRSEGVRPLVQYLQRLDMRRLGIEV